MNTHVTNETQAHPAGRGDPAPLTPLSILPVLASDWAGIRFLRTHLRKGKCRKAFSIFILEKQDVRFTAKPCFMCYTHVSLAGFLRRILGLGEETSVGAPPTPPPWVCACTMVATGWVVLKVLLMGLATKPSAKTTPEFKKNKQTLITNKFQ